MATQDYAASIQGVSIRVTRLDAAGNLLTGPQDSYTTSAFMRVSFTPEYEEGDEITEKGANGVVCVSYKAPDTLKRITMELAICEPDPELSALLSGGLLLRKNIGSALDPNNQSIGWAAPGVGDDPAGNGVAVEAWSHAVSGGKRNGVLPYFHWVFPYAKFRQSGDRVIENGLLANTFEGYGLGNINFESGIDGRWEFPVAAERPYAYARSSWAPLGLRGFYTWTDNATDQVVFTASNALQPSTVTIANAAITSNVATLRFSADPKVQTGDQIVVNNIGNSFDGTYTVTSATPSTSTFATANLTSDVITYTGTGLTLIAGDVISVTGFANANFNITSTAITTATATTVTVPKVAANIVTETATGTAVAASGRVSYLKTANNVAVTTVVAPGRVQLMNSTTEVRPASPVATTSFTDAVAGDSYNVPGSIVYNPDNVIDNIITANETGTASAN
jgi:hypothetical protein